MCFGRHDISGLRSPVPRVRCNYCLETIELEGACIVPRNCPECGAAGTLRVTPELAREYEEWRKRSAVERESCAVG